MKREIYILDSDLFLCTRNLKNKHFKLFSEFVFTSCEFKKLLCSQKSGVKCSLSGIQILLPILILYVVAKDI